jgi:hypothetical protein
MSQAGIINASGMPTVPTTFVTNSGNAVPALNVLNVLGSGTITTSGAGNTITISPKTGFQGTGSTIGAVTSDIVTLPLGAVPGVYTFDVRISGFDVADNLGVGYTLVGAVRTTGAAATLLPGQNLDEFEENATIDPATVDLVISGNSAIIRVTGVVALTIDWSVAGVYVLAT